MASGGMREQMPVVAALIDDLRSAFGAEYINKIIAAGMRGEPVFSASENGHTVGTPVVAGVRVVKDERGARCIVVEADGRRYKHTNDVGRREKLKGQK